MTSGGAKSAQETALFLRALNSIKAMLADRQRRVGLALTTGGLALLAVAAALATVLFFRVADATDWIEHSYIVRANIGQLLTAIDGVEIDARDRLLANFRRARRAYAADRKEIEREYRGAEKSGLGQQTASRQARSPPGADERATSPTRPALRRERSNRIPTDPSAGGDRPRFGRDPRAYRQDRRGRTASSGGAPARRRSTREGAARTCHPLPCLRRRSSPPPSSAPTGPTSRTCASGPRLSSRRARAGRKPRACFCKPRSLRRSANSTAGIAHDFNNLLTIVIGNLDNARMRLDVASSRDRVARSIELASDGARRAAELTQRLLVFSRQQPLAPRQIDLNKTVAGISEVLRRTVGETITIETVLAGGLWPAFADPHQVENAIVNLVVNARDAMPEGGKITIETANSHLDEVLCRLRLSTWRPGNMCCSR